MSTILKQKFYSEFRICQSLWLSFRYPLPFLAGDILEITDLHTWDISRLRVSKRQDGIWWRKRDFSHSGTHFNFQNIKINKCFFKFMKEMMRILPKYYRHIRVKQQDVWVCHFLQALHQMGKFKFQDCHINFGVKRCFLLWQRWQYSPSKKNYSLIKVYNLMFLYQRFPGKFFQYSTC